jgi:hypothetical protein
LRHNLQQAWQWQKGQRKRQREMERSSWGLLELNLYIESLYHSNNNKDVTFITNQKANRMADFFQKGAGPSCRPDIYPLFFIKYPLPRQKNNFLIKSLLTGGRR